LQRVSLSARQPYLCCGTSAEPGRSQIEPGKRQTALVRCYAPVPCSGAVFWCRSPDFSAARISTRLLLHQLSPLPQLAAHLTSWTANVWLTLTRLRAGEYTEQQVPRQGALPDDTHQQTRCRKAEGRAQEDPRGARMLISIARRFVLVLLYLALAI